MNKIPVTVFSSVECGDFLHGLIDALDDRGYAAEHRYQCSSAKYRSAHSPARRLWLRLHMYLFYPLRIIYWALVDRKPRIWVVTSNTFYAPWIASLFVRGKHRPVVHLLYDIFPEVLEASGISRPHGILSRICSAIMRATLNRTTTVVLGEHQKSHMLDKYNINPEACTVIEVGATTDGFDEDAPVPVPANAAITLLYCGNMGKMHDVETLMAAIDMWRQPGNEGLRFRFQASGTRYKYLREHFKHHGDDTIRLGGGLDRQAWLAAMKDSQVGIVTIKSGAENVLMPSKTYSAMMAGQAIIAICPKASDLAEHVIKYNCGWVIEPGDAAGLLHVFKAIRQDPAMLTQMRINAQAAARNHYDVRKLAGNWDALFKQLAAHGFPCPTDTAPTASYTQ